MKEITVELVKKLIDQQFPKWSNLQVKPVSKSGHDNRTFHLGDEMSVRLPSGENYVAQVEKENKWLPYLQEHLSFKISTPIAIGVPNDVYPYPFSINQWIIGETLDSVKNVDKQQFAIDLSSYLLELQSVDATNGPKAGKHNFYRGGLLEVYHQETKDALKQLSNLLPVDKLEAIWNIAMSSSWDKDGVWVHGDVAPGNLLLIDGKLSSLIDFGILGVGDPSCDYAMAWTFFDVASRETFYQYSKCDLDTWNRARGWALWKALITYNSDNEEVRDNAKHTINEILNELID